MTVRGAFGLSLAAVVSLAASAGAQLIPVEYTRPGPTPPRVAHGAPMMFARTFTAARHADRMLVAYIEDGPTRAAPLRTAAFTVAREGAGPMAVSRARDDVTVAPDARTVSLAWDGAHGAVVYVVPRNAWVVNGPSRTRRPPAVGLPPSTQDPLGPVVSSGGEVMFLRLDGDGRPVGEPRMLFSENSRLGRVAVGLDRDGFVVAWTGAAVTDDEVRGTVRAMRLDAEGRSTRGVASSTGFFGDPGGWFAWTHDQGRAVLLWTGVRCAAREGEPTPAPIIRDGSARVESPARPLMPQQAPREQPGPPIECTPLSLFRAELRADGAVTDLRARFPLASDAVSLTGSTLVAAAYTDPTRRELVRTGVSAADPVRALAGDRRVEPVAPPTREVSLALQQRPQDGVEPVLHEEPVAPMDRSAEAAERPRGVSAVGAAVVALAPDHQSIVRVANDPPRVLATSAMLFQQAVLAPSGDDDTDPLLLTREGVWSGPVRAFTWSAIAASPQPVALARVTATPTPPPTPPRIPVTQPYVYDEAFARLWVQAGTARAALMRYENMAAPMAARPDAPTNPSMPGIIARRTNLRFRWEGICVRLQQRASQLARQGAGSPLMQGVAPVCELHQDLQLGVPINPAL